MATTPDQSAAASPAMVQRLGKHSGTGQGRVPGGMGEVLSNPDAGRHRALAPFRTRRNAEEFDFDVWAVAVRCRGGPTQKVRSPGVQRTRRAGRATSGFDSRADVLASKHIRPTAPPAGFQVVSLSS